MLIHHRSSGGTNTSASSGGHNDNSSSSARLSCTSTLPSSPDIPSNDISLPNSTATPYSLPDPPIPEPTSRSLRAAGKALSFGRKKPESPIVQVPATRLVDTEYSSAYADFNRPRAMTETSYASESTTTPRNFLDGGFELGPSELDSFGSMFDNFGKRQSKLMEEPGTFDGIKMDSPVRYKCPLFDIGFANKPQISISQGSSRSFTQSYSNERMQDLPSPAQFRLSKSSPRSWASEDSQAGLMADTAHRLSNNFPSHDQFPDAVVGQALPNSRSTYMPSSASPLHWKKLQRPPSVAGGAIKRTSLYDQKTTSGRDSSGFEDEDAKLVMESLSASQRLNRQSGPFAGYKDSDEEGDNSTASLIPDSTDPSPYGVSKFETRPLFSTRQQSPTPVFDSSDQDFTITSWRPDSSDTTPRAKKSNLAHHEERSLFDAGPPLPDTASWSVPNRQVPLQTENKNKVMTPAQFERYRNEQEARRDQYVQKDDSDDEGDDYEDDDEVERNKQLARERRKQEAHLAVYRQQMMKVTGEQPGILPRPGLNRGTLSAPNIANRSDTPTFNFDKPDQAGKASDSEDEDVPLGVLAAHGFPSKNRPPAASSSHIQYRSETYPPPSASTAGMSAIDTGRGGLPPFARHLPSDPYFGAGLVNPTNRESLAFGQGGPASVYGAPSSVHGGSQLHLQPGGLVGVIAGEERARAARRGSPNAQGNYSSPLPPSMMRTPSVPLPMTPGEQATVQMSEQMNQMMQMQMQWMQQMQQMVANGMQGMPAGQPPPFMISPQQQQMMKSGMLAPVGQQQRPVTMALPASAVEPPSPAPAQQRAMSMVIPPTSTPWSPRGNNKISKGPSMMSGALGGTTPNYVPSIAPSERSNVGIPLRYRPVSIAASDEQTPQTSSRSSTFISGMLQPGASGRNSRLSTSEDRHSKLSMRPILPREPSKHNAESDDDDEEGWEEMKQRREKKKNTWRSKRNKDGHRGLDFYDYPEV